MRKSLLLLSVITFLLMLLTDCSNAKGDFQGSENQYVATENYINIGENNFPIKSVFSITEENTTKIYIKAYDINLTIELDDYRNVPVGVFELTNDGKYTAEAEMIGTEFECDLIGSLTIEKDGDIYSVTASGYAFVNRTHVPFSLDFDGTIDATENPS